MKKIAILLFVLLLTTALVACSTGGGNETTSPVKETVETTPETEPETFAPGVLMPTESMDSDGAVSAPVTVQIGGNTPVPCIINTEHPASDLVVADLVATDAAYGADPTGQTSSSAAINAAILACEQNGGGTVWLPAGQYLITETILVSPMVTLRGDWADPDTVTDGNYGTVLVIPFGDKGENNAQAAVQLRTSAGLKGVTIYYSEQDAENPIDTGWAIFYNEPTQGPVIENVTLLNAYDGIGLSPDEWSWIANSNIYVNNVKGTALNRGLVVYNNAGASSYENIAFSPKYWANATEAYNAPAYDTIAAFSRAQGEAFVFGDIEMPLIYNLSAEQYRYGVHTVPGTRIVFWGAGMSFLTLTETEVAMKIDSLFTGRMMGVVRSVLEGSQGSLELNDQVYRLYPNIAPQAVHLTDCVLSHEPGGTNGDSVVINNEGKTPEEYIASETVTKPSRAALYNVQKAPYNASCESINTELRLGEDCTAAIQAALDDAGAAGGGIVYLPAGHYVIRGNLTVPAGVELRGAGSMPMAPGPSGGTMLFLYADVNPADPDTEKAAITVNGEGAGIRQIQIYYPENPDEEGFMQTYPYAIRYENARSSYGENIFLASVYMGIDVADGSHGNYLHAISGTAAVRFIRIGKADHCHVETCHDINPGYWMGSIRYGREFYSNFDFTQFQRQNCRTITLEGGEDLRLLNILQFGAHYGLEMDGGSVEMWNFLIDNTGNCGLMIHEGKVLAMNMETTGVGKYTVQGEAEVHNKLYIYGW